MLYVGGTGLYGRAVLDNFEIPRQYPEVRATLELAARYIPAERLIASTNCGMAPMNRSIAYAKLRALGTGATTFATSEQLRSS